MTNRKVYRISAGNIKHLRITEEELLSPEPGEVQIAIDCIGLNFADVFSIWGLYEAAPKKNLIPGLEFSGKVVALGNDVQNVKIGDAVMAVTRFGAFASHINLDARYLVPVPSGWTQEEGASFLVQVLTAYYALVYLGNLQEGQTVLIHSAAGGVGTLAQAIAKKYNAYTLGTVGSSHKIDFCKSIGYHQVIVRSSNFKADLHKCLGDRRLDLVLETNGGKIFRESYDTLAPMGRMVVYSSARYATRTDRPIFLKVLWQFLTRPKIDPQTMTRDNKSVMGFNLIWLYEQTELMWKLIHEVQTLNVGKPHVGHIFNFEDMPEAIRLFQSGQTIGKVVVRVRHEN